MNLDSIIINNYRPFFGESIIEFNNEVNLNVIYGKNGCGKSILMDAIHWCLYGIEISDATTQPICNYNALNEHDLNEEIHVSVICKFTNNNKTLEARRNAYFTKIGDNEVKQSLKSNFEVTLFDGTEYHNLNIELLSKYFPQFLFPFLMLDNDHIDLDNYQSYNLKKLFNKFTIDSILIDANLHLNRMLDTYLKEIKSSNYNQEKYYNLALQQEKIMENVKKIDEEIHHYLDEIAHLERECRTVENKLRYFHHGDMNIADLYDEKQRIENYIDSLNKHRDDLFNKRSEILIKSFPIIVGLSTIKEKFNNNELENMLLKNVNFKNSRFYEGYFNISHLFDNLLTIDRLKDMNKKIIDIENSLNEMFEERKCLNDSISSFENPYFKELSSKYEDIKALISKLDRELDYSKSIKKSLQISLEHNSKDLNYYQRLEKQHSPINLKYQLCSETKEFGELVKKQFHKNFLIDFSKTINSFFIDNLMMKNKFKKVIVNEAYDIFIIKNSNQQVSIGDLSKNEQKLFILSLIFTIHECLQLNYPIILMDPFVNLDKDKRDALSSFILNNESCHQILLILNENQYDDNLKVKFLRNNVKELSLINVNGNVEVMGYD